MTQPEREVVWLSYQRKSLNTGCYILKAAKPDRYRCENKSICDLSILLVDVIYLVFEIYCSSLDWEQYLFPSFCVKTLSFISSALFPPSRLLPRNYCTSCPYSPHKMICTSCSNISGARRVWQMRRDTHTALPPSGSAHAVSGSLNRDHLA